MPQFGSPMEVLYRGLRHAQSQQPTSVGVCWEPLGQSVSFCLYFWMEEHIFSWDVLLIKQKGSTTLHTTSSAMGFNK